MKQTRTEKRIHVKLKPNFNTNQFLSSWTNTRSTQLISKFPCAHYDDSQIAVNFSKAHLFSLLTGQRIRKFFIYISIILTLRERQRATVDYSPLCHVTSIFGPCCFKKIGPFPPKKKRTSSTICRLLCHLAVGRHRMVGQFRGCIRLFRLVTLFIVYGPNYLM
jgi:hypothetical protein